MNTFTLGRSRLRGGHRLRGASVIGPAYVAAAARARVTVIGRVVI